MKATSIHSLAARAFAAAAVILSCLAAPVARAQMPSFPVGALYQCSGDSGPAYPYSALTPGRDGNLYGVSYYGGVDGYEDGFGDVFIMTPAGVVSELYSFTNGADGSYPYCTLVQGLDGAFYGPTSLGGASNCGVIFKITTNGAFTPLHSMLPNEGANVYGGLVLASDRNLYGVAEEGGSNGYGTVFDVTTNGVLTVLHTFTKTDGAYPNPALVEGGDGAFYGTTINGGNNAAGTNLGYGTVFRIATNGVFSNLYLFTTNNYGPYNPYGNLIQGIDGGLYGTASDGGAYTYYGAVFRITTNGVFTNLYSFDYTDGETPYGGLVQTPDGTLYGTCYEGGDNDDDVYDTDYDEGTIFGMTTNGVLTALYLFPDSYEDGYEYANGEYSYAGLTLGRDGNLYGSCVYGGANDYGTFFVAQLPALSFSNIYSFTGSTSDGAYPSASLVAGPDGNLYGTTIEESTNDYGSIFRISTNGVFTDVFAFDYEQGYYPYAPLTVDTDGVLYGTSAYGGTNGEYGNVFGITTNEIYTNLFSFDGTDGEYPYFGALVAGSNGVLYGTTYEGGPSNYGSVFAISPSGQFTNLYSFTNSEYGLHPTGGLALDQAGNLYGTTSNGGDGYGTVFEITAQGAFTNLYSFGEDYNYWPQAGLTFGADGLLYGTTVEGGTDEDGFYYYGSVFRMTTNGQVTNLHYFDYCDGAYPYGSLYLASDGYLYGATAYGGSYDGYGGVFRVSTNGVFASVYGFGYNSNRTSFFGDYPYGPPVQGADGNFYGTTVYGGDDEEGNVYRLSKVSTSTPASGSIMVTIDPDAVTNLAQWTIDADGVYYSSGETATNLSAGYHQICFTEVTNWTEPNCQEVLVSPGTTTDVEADYVTNFTVTTIVYPGGDGLVMGAGSYGSNSLVTVTASDTNNYVFYDWVEDDAVVSTNASYTFTISNNVSLTADFLTNAAILEVTYDSSPITNGETNVIDFGSVAQNQTGPIFTFEIINAGGAALNLSGIALPIGFTFGGTPPTTVAPGGSATLAVQLATTGAGIFSGDISITNNSPGESPFNFPIMGTVLTPPGISVYQGATGIADGLPGVTGFGSGAGWTSNQHGIFSTPILADGVLTLTDDGVSEARSFFFNTPQYVNAFSAGFTYTDVDDGVADGVAFVLQNDPRGPAALGEQGGYLGYGGTNPITPSAALEINLYNGGGETPSGYTFLSNGLTGAGASNGNYKPIGPLNIDSDTPTDVTLNYSNGYLSLNFYYVGDPGMSFSTNLHVGNLAGIVDGQTAYVGFTGGDGGVTSDQIVTNFWFTNDVSEITNNEATVVSFGTVQVGQTGPTITFTVGNNGQEPLIVSNITVPAGYNLVTGGLGSISNFPFTIAAGGGGTFSAQLLTSTAGVFSGNIVIANNTPGSDPYNIPVTGEVLTAAGIGVYDATTNITNGQTTAVDFGIGALGQPGPVVDFTVTNFGGEPLTITNISVSSNFTLLTSAPSTITSYPFVITASNSATFAVEMNTTNLGDLSGSVTLTTDAESNADFTFPLSGQVLQPPRIQLWEGAIDITNGDTTPVNFGSVQQTLAGPVITLTVSNVGQETLDISNIVPPAGFTVYGAPATTVAPGSSGSFQLQMETDIVADYSGSVYVTNNDPSNNPYSFQVAGSVTTPEPVILVYLGATNIPDGDSNAIEFGVLELNQAGPAYAFTVSNIGAAALEVTNISVPDGFALETNAPSTLTNFPFTIASLTNATFAVQLITTNASNSFGYVGITNNDPTMTNDTFTFAVAGTVNPPAPEIAVLTNGGVVTNGQAINFGTFEQGTTDPAITFTINNAGEVALTISNITAPTGFFLTAAAPTEVAASNSVNFTVKLSTTNAGPFSGDIVIANNASSNGSFSIAVSGLVLTPPDMLVLNGTTNITNGQFAPVSFGQVILDQTGPVLTFTVSNAGQEPLVVSNITVTSNYLLLTNGPSTLTNFPATLAGGSNGEFAVQLLTSNTGTFDGEVTITNNATTSNVFAFPVTGVVFVPASIAVFQGTTAISNGQTTPINFGSVLLGQTPPTLTFTITNSGQVTLDISSITVPTGFILLSNAPAAIPGGSNGTFTVQLATSALIDASGNIAINNSADTTFTFPVEGLVYTEIIALSGNLDFGVQAIDTASNRSFVISNLGNAPLTVTNITYPSNVFTGSWSNGSIAAGGFTNVTVTFDPAARVNYSGVVTVLSSANSGTNTLPIVAFGANPETNNTFLLTVLVVGEGKVTPGESKALKSGTKVKLTATPDKTNVFVNWTGLYDTVSNPLSFKLTQDTTVQANFEPNPFLPFVGTYNGLFWSSNGVTESNAGMLKALAVTSKGTYSGSLLLDGASKSINGSFSVALQASNKPVTFPGGEGDVFLTMELATNEVAPVLTGIVSNAAWVATNLLAERATNNNVIASAYTLLVPPDTNHTDVPVGSGYAAIKASGGTAKTAASATIAGSLADGTSFSQFTSVAADSAVPVYASLNGNKGLLIGWINLDPTNSTNATLYWAHPANLKGNLATNAFVSTNDIEISVWSNNPAIYMQLTNMVESSATNGTLIGIKSKGAISGHDVSGKLTPATGVFTLTIGSGADKVTAHGAVLLNAINGVGYTTSKAALGGILLTP